MWLNERMNWRLVGLALMAAAVSAADTADDALALAQRTLAYVERAEARPAMAAELGALARRLPQASEAAARAALEKEIRALRRKIIFSHPALAFDRLLASQRGLPYTIAPHMVDQYTGRTSRPGPGLVVIENWKTAPKKVEILKGKLPLGTVLNPDLHWDADRVLFAFCDHTAKPPPEAAGVKVPTVLAAATGDRNADRIRALDPENPLYKDKTKPYDPTPAAHLRYFIWEAALDGSWVRQLTGTPRDKMETWDGRQTSLIEDADPCYLPDGGFAFNSTRCQSFGRCHWGRYTPAFLIFRADGDGSNIRQLSFGEANEWEPAVLNDGRLIYTRWDYINRNAVWYQSLWTMRPDGTGTAHFYGNYTMHPGVQAEAQPVPGSHVVVATAGAHHYFTAGSLLLIDTRKGEDGPEPLTRLTPEIPWPESEGWSLPGCYAAPFPVNDTLFFASFSGESLDKPKSENTAWNAYGAWPSNQAFGLWLVDTLGGRERIYQDPEIGTFTPIPVRKRPRPPAIPSVLPLEDRAPDTGVCYVENVYDCREPLPKGGVKYLRVNELFNQPAAKKDTRSAGPDLEIYKRPLGVVPVAEDGSAAFRIPACRPIQLQALNAEGVAVFTMRSFIYAQKGEVVSCAGCHEDKMRSRPPQELTKRRSVVDPIPLPRLDYPGAFSFVKTVQPVLDRYCIRCHGLAGPDSEGKERMSLVGSQAYLNLVGRKLVSWAESYHETGASKTNDYFAAASPLTALLKSGHQGVALSKDEWSALVVWMDLNVPAHSDGGYGFNRDDRRGPAPEGEKRLRAAVAARFGQALAAQPFPALVNVGAPEKSRILLAALPAEKGGWGQLEEGFRDADDPAYREMLSLVQGAIAPQPCQDYRGTCGRGAACVCNSCWVWMGNFNR